jgi:hypothetical protein
MRWHGINEYWKRTMTVNRFRAFKYGQDYERFKSTILGKDMWGEGYGEYKNWNSMLWHNLLAAATSLTVRESRVNEALGTMEARESHAWKLAEDEMMALGHCPPHFKGIATCLNCGTVGHPKEDDRKVMSSCRWCSFPGVLNQAPLSAEVQ